MSIKLLQLNINADNYWDKLIPYLNSHDFDILHLQEITGKDTICFANIDSKRNCFEELKAVLTDKYSGELTISQRFTSSPHSYMGNATFYRKEFTLSDTKEVILFHKYDYFPSDRETGSENGRTLLHLTLAIGGRQISFLNTHFAWGGDHIEKPHQTAQGAILLNYLRRVSPPFVFSGDLNLTPEQPFIQKLATLARNLIIENKVTNTLDPVNHRAKHLFPKGLAVDYIFTSNDIQLKNFDVVSEGLSDHLGLSVELEI